MIKAENILFRIGKATLLKETSVEFSPGQFHVIMGANGAGKSTLLKVLAGDYKPTSGKVFLEGKELSQYSKKQLAKKRGVLSQHYHLAFSISVEEIVLMGRYPYFATQPSATDLFICRQAMELMDVSGFGQRDYTTLSGGEAQKVQMSRVLAQIWNEGGEEKKVLFLDEPVSHLDVKYQHQLLKVAKECCRQNTTVIAILHDINLAISFADRILFMREGEIKHEVQDVLQISPDVIEETFGVSAVILRDNIHPRPVVIF